MNLLSIARVVKNLVNAAPAVEAIGEEAEREEEEIDVEKELVIPPHLHNTPPTPTVGAPVAVRESTPPPVKPELQEDLIALTAQGTNEISGPPTGSVVFNPVVSSPDSSEQQTTGEHESCRAAENSPQPHPGSLSRLSLDRTSATGCIQEAAHSRAPNPCMQLQPTHANDTRANDAQPQ